MLSIKLTSQVGHKNKSTAQAVQSGSLEKNDSCAGSFNTSLKKDSVSKNKLKFESF